MIMEFKNKNKSEKDELEVATEFITELFGEEASFSIDTDNMNEVTGIQIHSEITPEQESKIKEKYPELG